MDDDKYNAIRAAALSAASRFAADCEPLLGESLGDMSALKVAMNDLMTELWDRGFSQTEIRTAFVSAVEDMNRYAAGEERRT